MNNDKMDGMTIEVNTPDGVLYYTICEDNTGRPIKVFSTFGKAGTSLAAWAFAVDRLVNKLFSLGVGINAIIDELNQITADKSFKDEKGIRVGSGPEGLVVALMEYKRAKYREMNDYISTLGD